MEKNKKGLETGDIHDRNRDKKYLRPENTTIDLPDVKDIPGQEHVRPPDLKEFADTTISSADEEGKRIFEDNDRFSDTSNVSVEEKELLERTANSMSSEDDENLRKSALDNKDTDGEPLNEQSDLSGNDLDVPGSELDDENEEIGEEDEENNSYSLGSDRKE